MTPAAIRKRDEKVTFEIMKTGMNDFPYELAIFGPGGFMVVYQGSRYACETMERALKTTLGPAITPEIVG